MKTQIYLGKVSMGSVQNNAGVLYGENSLRDWQTRSKGNSAFGRVNGDGNLIVSKLNLLNDPDLIDMIVKTDRF